MTKEEVRARFRLIVERADRRVAEEWAALKPTPGEPWNPSKKSPEELKARQRRNSIKASRRRRAAI